MEFQNNTLEFIHTVQVLGCVMYTMYKSVQSLHFLYDMEN